MSCNWRVGKSHKFWLDLWENWVDFVGDVYDRKQIISLTETLCLNTRTSYQISKPASLSLYRSFATRLSQLKIWNFWVIGIERNVCRCTFNRYGVITQFAKLAAGEQLCRRYTHRKPLKVSSENHKFWVVTMMSQMSDMMPSNAPYIIPSPHSCYKSYRNRSVV